jgi:DNA-binding Lrp family transcriptional regulator
MTQSIGMLSLANDTLELIATILPAKSIISFSRVSKAVNFILNNEEIKIYIRDFKIGRIHSISYRLQELKGPHDFDGLIHIAAQKVFDEKSAISKKMKKMDGMNDMYGMYGMNKGHATVDCRALEEAEKKLKKLTDELNKLAIFNDHGECIGGKLYKLRQ